MGPDQHAPRWGALLALLATALWAGNFILARVAPGNIDPVSLTFLRWLVASICLLPMVALPLWRSRRLLMAEAPLIIITALLGVSLFNTAAYSAGHYLDATRMSLVNAASPMLILLLSAAFLKERVTVQNACGSAIAVLGISLSVVDAGPMDPDGVPIGLALMVFAAFCFASYTVLFRRLQLRIPFRALIGATFAIGTAMLLPVFIVRGMVAGFPEPSPINVMLVLYAGVLATLVAFVAWNLAVSRIGAPRAGYIYYLVPVITALEAFLFIGEPPTLSTIVATPLVLAGVYLASRGSSAPATRPLRPSIAQDQQADDRV